MVGSAVPVLHARNQIVQGRHGPNPRRLGVWARVPAGRRHVHSLARHAGALRASLYFNLPPPSRPSVVQDYLITSYSYLNSFSKSTCQPKRIQKLLIGSLFPILFDVSFCSICVCVFTTNTTLSVRTALSCSTFPRTCCGWTRTSATANRRPPQRWEWWTPACKRTRTRCCRGPKQRNW